MASLAMSYGRGFVVVLPSRTRMQWQPNASGFKGKLAASVTNTSMSRRLSFPIITLFAWETANAAGLPMVIEPDIPRFVKRPSGLKIQEVLEGSGPEANEGDLVEFNYVCRRSNGYYVYSTMDTFNKDSQPVTFSLGKGQMISGLEQVIMGMKPGGKRRALIPPELGYVTPDLEPQPREFGRQRSLMAHTKEPLVFEVQLLKVT